MLLLVGNVLPIIASDECVCDNVTRLPIISYCYRVLYYCYYCD